MGSCTANELLTKRPSSMLRQVHATLGSPCAGRLAGGGTEEVGPDALKASRPPGGPGSGHCASWPRASRPLTRLSGSFGRRRQRTPPPPPPCPTGRAPERIPGSAAFRPTARQRPAGEPAMVEKSMRSHPEPLISADPSGSFGRRRQRTHPDHCLARRAGHQSLFRAARPSGRQPGRDRPASQRWSRIDAIASLSR